jgi:hypothetical protein
VKINIDGSVTEQIRRIVDEQITRAGPSWTSGGIAVQVVELLRTENPVLLEKWLDLHAVDVVRTMVNAVDRVMRQEARTKSDSVFSDAVARHEAGDKKALAPWLDTVYVVTTGYDRKRLADMDKVDLNFAAATYTQRARTNAIQAAFLRAIAEKVGDMTVGEVYDDEALSRMWRSLDN